MGPRRRGEPLRRIRRRGLHASDRPKNQHAKIRRPGAARTPPPLGRRAGRGRARRGRGGVLAGPAQATVTASVPVDFPTHCIPPAIAGIPPIDGTTKASITVDNAAPKVGETVTVTYTVVEAAASNPVDLALPADIMTPTGKVTVGGAQSASVTVAGPKKNDPVPGKGTFPSFSMTGTFTVTAPGSITLSPGDYNIHTSYIMELDTLHGDGPARPRLRDDHRDGRRRPGQRACHPARGRFRQGRRRGHRHRLEVHPGRGHHPRRPGR